MAPYTIHDMTVTEAHAAEQPLLGRLLQLYLHDFSEHAALGSPHGEVDGGGLFAYPPGLGSYWQEPGRVPGRRWSGTGYFLLHAQAAVG